MKNNTFLKVMIIIITAFTLSLSSCDDGANSCPSGMVECEIQNGETICVPEDLGC